MEASIADQIYGMPTYRSFPGATAQRWAVCLHAHFRYSSFYNRVEMVQRYISRELTHFVGRSLPTAEEQYRLLTEIILASGKLGSCPPAPSKCKLTEVLIRVRMR